MQRLSVLLPLVLLTGSPAKALDQPEAATTRTANAPGLAAPAQRFAVTAANPLAAQAGLEMLRSGGSAMDAAIAVQLVLSLVEPQSSGIAGGAFLLHWDGREVQALDGRETAPAAATPQLFLKADGKPMAMRDAVLSGLSTGTPGVLAMLAEGHRRHGQLPWARLFEPAIRLAEQGFAISPRLFELASNEPALRDDPQAGPYFFDASGAPKAVGTVLRNPAYATVLRAVAKQGAKGFYEGPTAEDIVRRVKGHARPGLLAASDLAGYQPIVRPPLCNDWRAWRICGFGAPTSGHLTLMQILGLLDTQPAAVAAKGLTADWMHAYAESAKLAFADRAQFIGDPAFVTAPGGDWQNLLAPDYLKRRGAQIGERAMDRAVAGDPGAVRQAWAAQAEQLEVGTSQISVVDARGRAVSMTTSVESAFGNRVMSDGGTGLAGGFMLNNQLTDFSLNPTGADGKPVANRVEAGKRPRSSMAPTLVFDRDGKLVMVAGSPGGPVIIHYVAKVITGTLAWGLPVQQAVDLPNFGHFNSGALIIERGALTAEQLAALHGRGQQVNETDLTSGLQVLMKVKGGWVGGADPRREGVVLGE
ncbi:gamma-glutamyltransferase family protein [Roseateles asaccharophilus]|uniref:Gamma-glutamyltranspeptidase/glutathione hydrolase n=1 Tax=Roseateles asaccharophilus TaxID=582607 RepID=A0ABU2A4R8_9BURK|nr:gamma-glutamyltransferase family protein [Roseateles asaccharophilus]MDR7332186.1 gamma-glutamyltranspeptidase/glutathione hydrolase [Roseateles asaccharophilus]